MRKFTIGLTLAAALLTLFGLVGTVESTPGDTLAWGSQVNAGECEAAGGRLVINVTHSVTNDGDSGVPRYWAYDNYRRHIQVWQMESDTFCVVVRYEGSFTTTAGASPGGSDPAIAAGIQGSFEGGYRAVVTGTLNPSLPTRGYIGAFDYGWDGHPTHGAHTPFIWTDAYFEPGYSFAYQWWGWVYRAGSNGTWVNSDDGNSGDITDG